jgi:poly-gamma-glutamate synthase PgsB/CapB
MVLAKTTGSGARYILPDGTEETVPRRGIVSILEQKRVISKAAALGVDCLVTEIMSIHPENHKIESQRIIKPHITILTNFRADHLDVADGSVTETESVYLNDVFAGTMVFVHRNHISPHLEAGIEAAGAILVPAEPGNSSRLALNRKPGNFRIEENLDLVYAVASHLQIKEADISGGIETARHDIGRPELFSLHKEEKTIWFASTFAANDPLSTTILMEQILSESGIQPLYLGGILSLRSDRAERTRQWIEFLQVELNIETRAEAKKETVAETGSEAEIGAEAWDQARDIGDAEAESNTDPESIGNSVGKKNGRFSYIFVTGRQRPVVKRMVPSAIMLKEQSPEKITEHIFSICPDKTIIFGLANIAGSGSDLVDYWRAMS